jgi:flagellar operon protein
MANSKVNNILIPNVSKLPKHKSVDVSNKLDGSKSGQNDFGNLLKEQIGGTKPGHGINLSVHAARRMQERNLNMDSSEYMKLKAAMDKLRNKGGQDSLVITDKAAYILDVGNNKIVTAIDKDSIAENVFTKIDSTLIIN